MAKKSILLGLLLLLISTSGMGQQEANLQQLMGLHRRAIGGIDALIHFSTASLQYDLSIDGDPVGNLEAWFGEEGLYREIVTRRNSWNSMSYDGSYAYFINPSTRMARSPHDPYGGGFDPYYYYLVFSSADIFPLMFAEKRGADISLVSQTSRGYSIAANYPNGAARTFILDVKMEIIQDVVRVERDGMRLLVQRRLTNYREFDGARLPTNIEVTIEGILRINGADRSIKQKRTMRLKKAKGEVDIDPGFFSPSFPASLARGMTFDIDDTTFRFGGSVPVGDDPESIRAADLNGDGAVDLITGDDGGVSLLLGEGDGTFPTHLALPAGGGSNEYALPVDLNGDGRLDVAVASTSSPASTLFLAMNEGNNRFDDARRVETGDFPESIAAADFDRDSHIDLAVAHNNSGDVQVHFGDGKGGVTRTIKLPLGGRGENVATADLNGDGSPDLLAVDQKSLYVFINSGDGSFSEPAVVASGPLPYCLAAADFNADGNADVIVGNGGIFEDAGQDDFALFYGKGDGTFQTPRFISAGASIAAVDVADVNGDGAPDAVAASFGTHEAVLLINDEGTLRHAGMLPCSWSPSAVALADLNGDGSIDIAVANEFGDDVSIWLNSKVSNR